MYNMTSTMEPRFHCKRCGYGTPYKQILERHLQSIRPCLPVKADLNVEDLLKELRFKQYNDVTYDCEFCKKKFNSRSSMYRHKNICKVRKEAEENASSDSEPETKPLEQKKRSALEKQNAALEARMKALVNETSAKRDKENVVLQERLAKVELELAYLRNKRQESFYQKLLENHYNATHKKLPSGITDITTDNMHAEVKNWECYKEAKGQLDFYNLDDPKEELHVYFFGNRSHKEDFKQRVCDTFNKYGIKVFDMVDREDGTVEVINYSTKETLFSYKPE